MIDAADKAQKMDLWRFSVAPMMDWTNWRRKLK